MTDLGYLVSVKAVVFEVSISMDCPLCGKQLRWRGRSESPLRVSLPCNACAASVEVEQELLSDTEVASE